MAVALHIIRHNERRAMRRERVFRDRTNIMDSLNDIELISRYRLDRRSIFDLVDVLAPHLERPTLRNFAIPPLHQVLTTLRYYAKGGFLSEIGDIHGISRSSVSRIISSVTTSLVSSLLYKLKFPLDQPSLREIKQDFHNMYGMPNVVGAVDGTLIPIIRPSEDEQIFVCRKNYHSLNVQAICDAKMKFTNVVAKWPGNTHDSFIMQNCSLSEKFENKQIDGWLLGDSGYPLKPWLLTPFLNPSSNGEEKYNRCHKSTRNVIERAFGLLKSRFRCLHKTTGCLHFIPKKCTNIVVACFILHNICIDKSIPQLDELLEDDNNENDHEQPEVFNVFRDGINTRASLVRQRFN
ncbi:Hypothetical predicted protein [Mytilus galloprovincialis]|uniref:Putative nuclease HARBI1 n=2 Tax=Mytilus TaxID=6548 RepID=A0A8B6GE02_MYTGA|nr:Hypothetical predicted protein [Mytilus galloprovincialis]